MIRLRRNSSAVILPLGLAALGGAFCIGPPALAQPPEAERREERFVPQVEAEWKALRAQVGSQEFSAPATAIARYQQFYEQRGYQSATTALAIAGTIAQMYWKLLNNPAKALEIYDWALEKYDYLPQAERLQEEREHIAQAHASRKTALPNITLPNTEVTAPLTVAPSGAPPQTITVPNAATGAATSPLAVKTRAPWNQSGAAPVAVSARLTALSLQLRQWRSGKLTLEEFLQNNQVTAQDALLLLSSPLLVTGWMKDAPLRSALAQRLNSAPELLKEPLSLPLSAQFAVAEWDTQNRNLRAETLFQNLLNQELPPNSWLTKMIVAYRLAEYYGAMGQFEKAAQTKLQIGQYTTAENWLGNAQLGAARYFVQAGQTDKAQQAYQKAGQIDNAWTKGLSITDNARALMAQGEHEAARKLLSTPVAGAVSQDIEALKQMLIGDSYYATGDLENARRYLQEALTTYHTNPNPRQGEGGERIFAAAQERLQIVEKWIKEPIQVEPHEFVIQANDKQPPACPLIGRLQVRTFGAVPLVVTSSDKSITARVSAPDAWGEEVKTQGKSESEREVVLEVAPEAWQKPTSATLTIGSPQFAYQVQVPIRIETAK